MDPAGHLLGGPLATAVSCAGLCPRPSGWGGPLESLAAAAGAGQGEIAERNPSSRASLLVALRALRLDCPALSSFQGLGGFSGFVMSMLVVFLVSTRKIHSTMSGYQVLRSVLQFLGEAAELSGPPPQASALLSATFDIVWFLAPLDA